MVIILALSCDLTLPSIFLLTEMKDFDNLASVLIRPQMFNLTTCLAFLGNL